MKRKFWNWIKNEDESVPDMERTLFLNGMISDETWYGDEVTPQLFKDELSYFVKNVLIIQKLTLLYSLQNLENCKSR